MNDKADKEFWSWVAEGNLRLQRCAQCGTWVVPPAMSCPECLTATLVWTPVSGRGTVWSYTVYHHAFAEHLAELIPYSVVLVELDEGCLMLGNLEGPGRVSPVIGEEVQVHCGDRRGSPFYWFEPVRTP